MANPEEIPSENLPSPTTSKTSSTLLYHQCSSDSECSSSSENLVSDATATTWCTDEDGDKPQSDAIEIDALVSPKDFQSALGEDAVRTDAPDAKEGIYKTPRSRLPEVAESGVVAGEVETTPKKIRDTPLPLLSWAESDEVWQNLIYKEEAMGAMRNVRIFDNRATYLPRMRAILLDWIMEVCEVYHLRRNTYYLAVDYIDRYLTAKPSVPKTQLQLLGVACLFIAAKLEEIYPPKLSEFSYVCDGACTEEEILTCEIVLLNTLAWEVNAMTPSSWLNLYMQIHHNAAAITVRRTLAPLDPVGRHFEYPQYSGYEFVRASHLMDIFSMDPAFLRFSYSTIAAGAMHFAYGEEVALRVSGLKRAQLRECTSYMRVFTHIIDEALDPRLASIVPTQDDDRLQRSFSYVRRHVPRLVQNEDHSIQTHLIDLDYFERSVLLRVEQYGIGVRKTPLRKHSDASVKSADGGDKAAGEEADETTVMVYELTPKFVHIDSLLMSPPAALVPPPYPTDADYEVGKVNIFTIAQKTTVTFDDILSSVHHNARTAKVMAEFITSGLGYQ